VSEISRSMVEEYGMGSQLISRDDVHASALLSEATRAKRDAEQQALIDEAQWEARCLISDNRRLLDQLAAFLLRNEALDRDEIDMIMAGESPQLASPAESIEDRAGEDQTADEFEIPAETNGHSTENSVPPPVLRLAPSPDDAR
jgi:cell division protease FtsH